MARRLLREVVQKKPCTYAQRWHDERMGKFPLAKECSTSSDVRRDRRKVINDLEVNQSRPAGIN